MDVSTVQHIAENPYMQFFLGLKGFQTEPLFDALQEYRVQCIGYREDNMEILGVQKVLPLPTNPLLLGETLAFGAVPVPARIVGNLFIPALIAPVDMRTQRCSTTGQDGAHRLRLNRGESVPILELGAVLPEDILYLTHRAKRCQQDSAPHWWCWPGAGKPWWN